MDKAKLDELRTRDAEYGEEFSPEFIVLTVDERDALFAHIDELQSDLDRHEAEYYNPYCDPDSSEYKRVYGDKAKS